MPTSPYYRPTSFDEQQLYDHLIDCRKSESPEALLERFHSLFVEGTQYAEPQVLATLHKLAAARSVQAEFKFILNRCCRILINFWWFQPAFRWAIPELVYSLQASPRRPGAHPRTQALRQLVREFITTDEYKALQRLAQVVEEGADYDGAEAAQYRRSRGTASATHEPPSYIHRYPYLYPYCLANSGGDTELNTVRHLQAERQQKFERDLSRYVTYMVQQTNGSTRTPAKAIANPTLLTDSELRFSIKHFAGSIERIGSYQDQARRFSNYTAQVETYRDFKEGLYRYLISSIDAIKPDYGKHHFNQWLYNQLKNTLPQSDTQRVSDFLITRTFHQLIDALVALPQQVNNHLVFVDLISNVGATVTSGLLLKLLLLQRNLKSSLEKRLAMLYKHYEPVMNGVHWLIESLENLQIAFSIHFGSMNLPCINRL